MSLTTFVDIQNEILAHRLNDTKYRPPVKDWINEGQRFIYLQTDIRGENQWQVTEMDAGVYFSPLPDDFMRLLDLTTGPLGVVQWKQLDELELREWDELAPIANGLPTSYIIIGNYLHWYPFPDLAYQYQLRYYPVPPLLTADGDVPILPEHYRHMLVRYALIRAFEREDDLDKANYYREAFDADLMKLKTQAQYDTHDRPKQVPGMFEEGPYISSSQWYG